MEHRRQVNRMLHDEHMAVIGLLERFQAFLATTGTTAPAGDDLVTGRMLSDISTAVEIEISTHFGFEEDDLFPCLQEAGYDDLGEALAEEHRVILPLGRDVAERARSGRGDGFSEAAWIEFRRLGGEFAERLISHARSEEIGLLPALEIALDDEIDARLAGEYAMKR